MYLGAMRPPIFVKPENTDIPIHIAQAMTLPLPVLSADLGSFVRTCDEHAIITATISTKPTDPPTHAKPIILSPKAKAANAPAAIATVSATKRPCPLLTFCSPFFRLRVATLNRAFLPLLFLPLRFLPTFLLH